MVNEKMIKKIISGGQTGADRAALDFAISRDIDYGGWVPLGRRAEDGPIPASYSALTECESTRYEERTERNVADSDGTLILSHGAPFGGSLLTYKIAANLLKPCLIIDFQIDATASAAAKAIEWLEDNEIETLNVAGPRASSDPAIYDKTIDLLTLLFD